MWQAETFDPGTIDKEFSWAKSIGFNTMRVYLHSIAWKQDPDGFKKRIDQYLKIADKHGIKTMFAGINWVMQANNLILSRAFIIQDGYKILVTRIQLILQNSLS